MSKTKLIQAIRGMRDILPQQTAQFQKVERILLDIFDQYGYQEIRLPIMETTELFQRGIGEVTDIVEKEMYTFLDRNEESLTLRPEGTAGCVRAVIEHGMLYHQTQKLWYSGPMFRYERPQKGRYRQFYQTGVEAFGFAGYLIEAELILLMAKCFEKLQLIDKVSLQINSLGSVASRARFREKFVQYCENHFDRLDEDSKRRLKTNPLRILDSKNSEVKTLLQHAPKLNEFLDEPSQQSFKQLCGLLDKLQIKYEINPYLVRGLDYYTGTVFEWVTSYLGAQNTICAGGRYDELIAQLGGTSTPAVGFAIGMERLVELQELAIHLSEESTKLDGYFIFIPEAKEQAFVIAERLRKEISHIKLEVYDTEASFKSQFKRADKSGARFALILGQDEYHQNMITYKDLRQEGRQEPFELLDLISYLRSLV